MLSPTPDPTVDSGGQPVWGTYSPEAMMDSDVLLSSPQTYSGKSLSWVHGSGKLSSTPPLRNLRRLPTSRNSLVGPYTPPVLSRRRVTLKKADGTPIDIRTLARNNSASSIDSSLSSSSGPITPSDTSPATNEIIDLLRVILNERTFYQALLSCQGTKAQQILDQLHELLTSHIPDDNDLWWPLLVAMMRLCKTSGMYPRCLTLRDIQHEANPVTDGRFGEIRRGIFHGHPVCLKVVKLFQRSQIDHLIKNFVNEGVFWSHLSHRNLLPFYGIYQLDDALGRVCLVSPWMENGNICDYLKANPAAPRIPLIREITLGLDYLHQRRIVHGDLKGTNIMITSTGSPCLADFGLSSVVDVDILRWTSVETLTRAGGTVRWEAPELLEPPAEGEMPRPTCSSDVYSLASVMYEVLTDKQPFHELPRDLMVIRAISEGKTPSKPDPSIPSELTEKLWELMILCWSYVPTNRPPVGYILEKLLNMPVNGLTAQRQRIAPMQSQLDQNKPLPITSASFRAAMWCDQSPQLDIELFRSLQMKEPDAMLMSTKVCTEDSCPAHSAAGYFGEYGWDSCISVRSTGLAFNSTPDHL